MKPKASAVFLFIAVLLSAACGPPPLAPRESEPAAALPDDAPVAESAHREVTLVAVGDLMVHADQLRTAFDAETGGYDFTASFDRVAADISAGDLALGNLETVLAGEEAGYSGYPRFNAPDSFARALVDAGFDFLTTANNHCMDMGEAGLLRTLEVLDRFDLGHTGTFSSPADRSAVAIRAVNGIRIAFVSFTYGTNDIPVPQDKPYLVNLLSRETVLTALSAAKAQNADWIIALPHMGAEYESAPREIFVEWVNFMIACGADMVLASHPHVLQPMEVRTVAYPNGEERKALAVYSLGNFLSSQREAPRETGMILRLHIAKDGGAPAYLERASFLPTWVQYRDADGRLPIRVLPVCDAILDYEGDNRLRLLPQDYTKLRLAHEETTALYLANPVSRNNMQREYDFYTCIGPKVP